MFSLWTDSERPALVERAETLPKVLLTDIDLNWLQVWS